LQFRNKLILVVPSNISLLDLHAFSVQNHSPLRARCTQPEIRNPKITRPVSSPSRATSTTLHSFFGPNQSFNRDLLATPTRLHTFSRLQQLWLNHRHLKAVQHQTEQTHHSEKALADALPGLPSLSLSPLASFAAFNLKSCRYTCPTKEVSDPASVLVPNRVGMLSQ
jgi:hypothetical protein